MGTATAGEYTEVHSYTVQSYSGWASCTGYFWLQCASEQKTRQFAVVRIGSIVVSLKISLSSTEAELLASTCRHIIRRRSFVTCDTIFQLLLTTMQQSYDNLLSLTAVI